MSFQLTHGVESTHVQEPPRKHRKMVSEGGGRAWTEEEETYLLQTRQQKMPYKHIAAHLGKTELACRLHHHHLTQGTNRRKRAKSCSSNTRGRDSSARSALSTPPREASAKQSRSHSPEDVSHKTVPLYHLPSEYFVMPSSAPLYHPQPQAQQQHPLIMFPSQISRLPTPPTEPLMANVTAPLGSDSWFAQGPKATYVHLPPPSASAQAPPPQTEMDRLHAVYDAHRNTFLAAIASAQGVDMGSLMTSVLA